MSSRVGVVGLGKMGSAMAGRLLDAGYDVWLHNRSANKAEPLRARGAQWADSAKALAGHVDLVISTVADDDALTGVALGPNGILSGPSKELTYADMSTVSVSASATVAAAAAERSVTYLRAPVTGSTVLADSGSLGILISGDERAVEQFRPVFSVLGKSLFYLGAAEEARVMKLALNMVLASTIVGLTEGLVLGECYGLDRKSMLAVFGESAVGSPLIRYKTAPLTDEDFTPAFSTEMLMKDLDLAIGLGRSAGLPTPAAGLNRDLLQATAGLGFGAHDFAAVITLFETLSGRRKLQPDSGSNETKPS